MSVAAPEATRQQSPAAQAMTVAAALAVLTQAAIEYGATAYLLGGITRGEFTAFAAQQILRAIARATTAGQHAAEQQSGHQAAPRLIRDEDQQRIEAAVATITEGEDDQVVMRVQRLSRAEIVQAGRTAYAGTTANALEDAPEEYRWKFSASADACARCLDLAARIFDRYEDAPREAGHIGCECVLDIHEGKD